MGGNFGQSVKFTEAMNILARVDRDIKENNSKTGK